MFFVWHAYKKSYVNFISQQMQDTAKYEQFDELPSIKYENIITVLRSFHQHYIKVKMLVQLNLDMWYLGNWETFPSEKTYVVPTLIVLKTPY